MKQESDGINSLAGIQYIGEAGVTISCKNAIFRFIHFGDVINKAKLLTSCHQASNYPNSHCFLLTVNDDDFNPIAVKSGFSSGYSGEGPRGLSIVLQGLERHGTEIKEYLVSSEIIEKIDQSSLTTYDLDVIEASQPVSPAQWYDYIIYDSRSRRTEILRSEFPLSIPFGIIDSRLIDLALNFPEKPDFSILSGYRRLEGIIRDRTGLEEHGVQLFAKAFQVNNSPLTWKDINSGEQQGRAQLFIGTYMAFRNRRAHREIPTSVRHALQEFLLLNHLYSLEQESIKREE